MGGRGEASPKGGEAVSILELCLKLLDGVPKLVGILTGINKHIIPQEEVT